MAGRTIPALLAAARVAAPAVAEELNTDDPDNPAHVGLWRVNCAHDGNLHGRDFESCGARAKVRGGELWISRSPREMDIGIELKGCIVSTALNLDVKQMAAGSPSRVQILQKAARRVAAAAAEACHRPPPHIETALSRDDLARVLELSDGLGDFGDDR
jgi:hypothetical protein